MASTIIKVLPKPFELHVSLAKKFSNLKCIYLFLLYFQILWRRNWKREQAAEDYRVSWQYSADQVPRRRLERVLGISSPIHHTLVLKINESSCILKQNQVYRPDDVLIANHNFWSNLHVYLICTNWIVQRCIFMG